VTDPTRPAGPGEPPAIPEGPTPAPTGRELVRREAVPPSVERFTAPDTAHTVGLTEERAAQIVRQSANARSIGLAALLFVIVFIPIYWLWENGFPLAAGTSRLAAEATTQYVTDVARGENIFLANCARCHGANGKGEIGPYGYVDSHGTAVIGYSAGIGPPLNDQDKLYQSITKTGSAGPGHLNPNYLNSVLTEGGRYVCGDPKSLMPVWAQANGGPLDYLAIRQVIAFITASSDVSWQSIVVDPATGQQTLETKHGWRDPTYDPGADATPFPACWRAPAATASPSASGSPSASPTAAASLVPGTSANPRIIAIDAQASLTFDPNSIVLVPGETVRFEITNTANFTHDFYIGAPADVEARNVSALKGVPDFATGTETLDYTVPASGELEFACLVPGHLEAGMRGTVTLAQQ
jgi:plastocyanin/mono/diheme cytochrome c family protein